MTTAQDIRPSRARRGFVRTLAIVLGACAALIGAGALTMQFAGSGGEVSSVDVQPARSMTFDVSLMASGELQALRQTEIRCELESQATINELIDEGVRVEKGEMLVRLNSDEIERKIEDELLQVEAARSDLVAAQNTYEIQISENEAALRQAKLKLDLAEIELEKWEEGDLIKKREDLELKIEQAERRLEQSKEKFEESKKLFDRGFLASDELKGDEIAYIQAQADLKQAKSEKWVYETFEIEKQRKKLTSDVEEARAEVERVKRQNTSRLASKEADVTNRQRQLSIREERLANLESQLEAATVEAPTSGMVVYGTTASESRRWDDEGPLQIGRTVRPNELLIVLPDTEQMIASVRIHEAHAGRIKPGQKALVRVDAVRDRVFEGEVMDIGVLAESGGWRDPNLREYTVRVLIEGENIAQRLKPSMRCEAEIVVDKVSESLAVPTQAVFRDGSSTYVYTPTGDRFTRTPVQVGRRSAVYAEITGGLGQGDRVLLREPRPGEVIRQSKPEKAVATAEKGDGERAAKDEGHKAKSEAVVETEDEQRAAEATPVAQTADAGE